MGFVQDAYELHDNCSSGFTDFCIADKVYFEPVFWEHIYEFILMRNHLVIYVRWSMFECRKSWEYGSQVIGKL